MLPTFLAEIIADLRRRLLPLGIDDIMALHRALAIGFGWQSTEALRELCVALWAKSASDAAMVRAVFARAVVHEWDVTPDRDEATHDGQTVPNGHPPGGPEPGVREGSLTIPATGTQLGAGGQPLPASRHDEPGLLLVPQYPLTERAIAQAWRRLRRPLRSGPWVELDFDATLRQQASTGMVSPPVLARMRLNAARLVLLIDVDGSMSPYRGYVTHILDSIARATRLDDLSVRYFHDVPGHTDRGLLSDADPEQPHIDRLLAAVPPLQQGRVYMDRQLTGPVDLTALAARVTRAGAVAIISDAGAARGHLDTIRLLDTIAFLKVLAGCHPAVAWLNPVPRDRWQHTTAALVERYVPMFPLTRTGMHAAVDVLRGRATTVVRPL